MAERFKLNGGRCDGKVLDLDALPATIRLGDDAEYRVTSERVDGAYQCHYVSHEAD